MIGDYATALKMWNRLENEQIDREIIGVHALLPEYFHVHGDPIYSARSVNVGMRVTH